MVPDDVTAVDLGEFQHELETLAPDIIRNEPTNKLSATTLHVPPYDRQFTGLGSHSKKITGLT